MVIVKRIETVLDSRIIFIYALVVARTNKITDNALVGIHNDIIPTIAKLRLSEGRLFQYCIAHYDSKGGENLSFGATVDELRRFFCIDKKIAYGVVREAVMKINFRPLQYEIGNEERLDFWFTGFTYFRGEGRFEFRLNKDAMPYFLKLQEFFTRYPIGATKKFKRAASFKLYVNLKSQAFKCRWDSDLDDLKYRLGVSTKYDRWTAFKQWVLVPSVAEINEHSDLSVTWKPKKSGRRVIGVAFKIKAKCDVAAQNAREIHEVNNVIKASKKERDWGTGAGSLRSLASWKSPA